MTILNYSFNNIGQAGQNPQFVYIDTDETIAQVTAVGFLNKLAAQGLPLSETLMAVVSTKTSPGSKNSQLSLFDISFSNGKWSLIPNASEIILPNDQILIGNSSNIATPRLMSGDATLSNTGVITLAPTLRPTAVIKLFGTLQTTGGSTTYIFPIPGVDHLSDLAFCQFFFNPNNAVILEVSTSVDDQLTIRFNVDPGASALLFYQVIRPIFI